MNGSVGQVTKFSTVEDAKKAHVSICRADGKEVKPQTRDFTWPVVRFLSGGERLIIPEEFTINNADGSMEARREQV